MKNKIITLLVIISTLSLTSCQEDQAIEELLQDTELGTEDRRGAGGDYDIGDNDVPGDEW